MWGEVEIMPMPGHPRPPDLPPPDLEPSRCYTDEFTAFISENILIPLSEIIHSLS